MAMPEAPVVTPDTDESADTDLTWKVVVWNDPVNLFDYVIWVLMELFGHPKEKAERAHIADPSRGPGDRQRRSTGAGGDGLLPAPPPGSVGDPREVTDLFAPPRRDPDHPARRVWWTSSKTSPPRSTSSVARSDDPAAGRFKVARLPRRRRRQRRVLAVDGLELDESRAADRSAFALILEEATEGVVVSRAEAHAFLRVLVEIRLALAARLGVEVEEDYQRSTTRTRWCSTRSPSCRSAPVDRVLRS
jgi:hypothetical protein